jgi:hypothetical protein
MPVTLTNSIQNRRAAAIQLKAKGSRLVPLTISIQIATEKFFPLFPV